MKHTPTPWVYTPYSMGYQIWSNELQLKTPDGRLIPEHRVAHCKDKANAAFIVRAANLYRELVMLLEEARLHMISYPQDHYGKEIAKRIKQALAKVKEKSNMENTQKSQCEARITQDLQCPNVAEFERITTTVRNETRTVNLCCYHYRTSLIATPIKKE